MYNATLETLHSTLVKFGVAVLPNWINKERADELAQQLTDDIIRLCPKVTNDAKTWKSESLPLGPRWGMYQSIVSHLTPTWAHIDQGRSSDKILPSMSRIIDCAWCHNSHQGHCMLTPACIQGQLVLSDTSAAFVCTPGSHLKHDKILAHYGETSNDWIKRNATTLRRALTEGRTTNHWGTRLFAKKPFRTRRNDSILHLLDHPELYMTNDWQDLQEYLFA
jgi:hypothetical protein